MDTLYIPVNIKTRYELFDGYGFKELLITLVVTGIVLGLSCIYHFFTGSITTPVLITMVSIAATITFTTKDQQNQSLIDHIDNLIRFMREQKKYEYKYLWEWD